MTLLNREDPREGSTKAPGEDLGGVAARDEATTRPLTIRWRACGPGLGERRGYVLGREVLDISQVHGHGEYLLRFMCREQGRFTTVAAAKGHAGWHVEGWWAAWQACMRAADEAARRETEAAEREAEAQAARRERRVGIQQRIAALKLAIEQASQGLMRMTSEVEGLIVRVLAELDDPEQGREREHD